MWWQMARCEKFIFSGGFWLTFWSFLLWRKNCTLLLKHMRRLRNCLIITETAYFSIMQYDTYKMYYICYNEAKVCDDKRHIVKISYFLGRVVNFFIIFVLQKKSILLLKLMRWLYRVVCISYFYLNMTYIIHSICIKLPFNKTYSPGCF